VDWQDVQRVQTTEIPPLEAKETELAGKEAEIQEQLDIVRIIFKTNLSELGT